MPQSPLRAALLAGFVFGSVAYGAVLSVLHLLHNDLASRRDAALLWAAFTLLYGLAGAAACGVGVGLAGAASRWRDRRRFSARPDPATTLRGGLLLGLLAFNLVFWELFWLYGLTYDQVPFFRPSGPWPMLGYVALLVVVIAVVVFVLTRILARALAALTLRGVVGRVGAAAWILGLAVHLGLASASALPKPPETRSAAAAPGAPRPDAAAAIPRQDTGLKVVLVGLDGADWQVLRPMIDRGELPAFQRLLREGAGGALATLPDSNSAVIWASLYTGATPERHGILDFYTIHLAGMAGPGVFPVHRSIFKEAAGLLDRVGLARQVPIDRFSLHALPIWEICDRLGVSMGLVDGYLYSFPALKPTAPEGFFFSYGLDQVVARSAGGTGAARRPEFFVQPKELYREVRPLVGGGDFWWQSSVLLHMLERGPQPTFVNLYTHQPDTFQHWYWKWFQPQYYLGVTPEDLAAHGDAIPKLHRDFDAFLTKLRATVDPNTVVVVASDHGHAPTLLHTGAYYTQHRHGPPGILLMAGGPVRPGLALHGADIYDLYPTLLYLLGLPVPRDAAGKVLVEALEPAFVQAHPVRQIPTYEVLGPPPGLPGVKRDSDLDRQELDKLKSLGYI
jgi:Type I phosphodiesterase / nucleotide pyrophosphatase